MYASKKPRSSIVLCRDVSTVPSHSAFVMSRLVSTRISEFIETFRDKVLHFSMLLFTESKNVFANKPSRLQFFLQLSFLNINF